MRTLKPQALTALNGPFHHAGKVRLVVVVGAMTSWDGTLLEQEQTIWGSIAKLPGSAGILDEVKPKVRGEALLSGLAFAPGGKPAPVVAVRLEVGSIAKEVWAVGDRYWEMSGPTDPTPFETMPLSYDRAFGGEGFAQNPTGKGFAPVKGDSGRAVHPLPNLEIAKKLVTSPRDRPPVAGFSPIDVSLPQRMKKLGTYDQKWLETRYPEMAADFDPTHFNVAPDDQWIEGVWQGGEPFVVTNAHPDKPRIEGQVPRFKARALLTRRETEEGALEDVPLRCDTLWFLPNQERLVMLFRGAVEVADEEASDVLDLLVGLERQGEPKPVEHYREVRRKRLDKDKGALHALRDLDLLPSDIRIMKSSAISGMTELLHRDKLSEANMRRRAERERESAREQLRAHGVDPDQHVPKELPPEPDAPEALHELPDYIEQQLAAADAARREAETKKAEARARLREQAKHFGLDADVDKRLGGAKPGGPPKFNAEEYLARIRKQARQFVAAGSSPPKALEGVDDPALLDKLQRAEAAVRDGYRQAAHHLPPAAALGDAESRAMRLQVETILIADHSLVDRDFTGADLSGMDFSNRDLSGILLEGANLTGCSFRSANVSRAVFTRANLTGADFDAATARSANFGHADLTRAKLTNADLNEAVLIGAKLASADFSGAKLHETQLSEVLCDKAMFAGVHAVDVTIMKGDLRGVSLRGARIERAVLVDVDLGGADLTGASIFRASLVDVRLDDACMREIKLERVCFANVEKRCSLARADLRGASLRRVNLRGVDLRSVDLREAELSEAELSRADLTGANLEAIRARGARFVGTDLTGANVARADLLGARMGSAIVSGATFEEANLFRMDADRMRGDDRTSFARANVKWVRVTPATRARVRAPQPDTSQSSAPEPPKERS